MGTSMRAGMLTSLCVAFLLANEVHCTDLTIDLYDQSCPSLHAIVRAEVRKAVQVERRMAASLLRLEYHDCFVNGCDGSILLDDTPSFLGEKTAVPNNNSARGFEVIDSIKAALEEACPETVSCADILAITARDASVAVGADSWDVYFGRRDSLTANFSAAADFLPSPFSLYPDLVKSFARVGLDETDLVALSGAHTIGRARCAVVSPRLYPPLGPDNNINPCFFADLKAACPQDGRNPLSLNNLDLRTGDRFDNQYYRNLRREEGLLRSDEVLYTTPGSNVGIVKEYSVNQDAFFTQFGQSMINMGNIAATGTDGEIRLNCRVPNSGPLYADQ